MNYQFDTVTVRLPDLRAYVGTREIHLSMQQMKLLLIMMSDPFNDFSAAELVRRVGLTSDRALRTLITVTRDSLGQRYIINKPRIGYSFAEA